MVLINDSKYAFILVCFISFLAIIKAEVTCVVTGSDACRCPTECNAESTGNCFEIMSPNYPGLYSRDVNCEWLLTAERGYSVQLTITDMHVSDYADYLLIYNQTESECGTSTFTPTTYLRLQMTGTVAHFVYKSACNQMKIAFNSGADRDTSRGFKATYTQAIEVNECSSNPCFNGGTCTDLVDAFSCQCAERFTGILCQTALSRLSEYGPSAGDHVMDPADDAASSVQILSQPFPFFGQRHTDLYVSTNGIVTFGQGNVAFTPEEFPTTTLPIFAVFWSNTDTRTQGNIFYRVVSDDATLRDLSSIVAEVAERNGICFFRATLGFIATWEDVAQFDNGNGRNTYQIILMTDGVYSFAVYKYISITWTHPTDNSRVYAHAGFNAGDGVNFFNMAVSGTADVDSLAATSNVRIPGTWIFRVDGGERGDPNDCIIFVIN